MDDVKTKKVNLIIVFKLDRLTRSIKDLEEIVNILEENEINNKRRSNRPNMGKWT